MSIDQYRSVKPCAQETDAGTENFEKKPSSQLRNLDDMKSEQLYLLEVLVNSVEVQPDPKETEPSPLCVRIKFLDFPCIEVCQDDFFGSDDEPRPHPPMSNSATSEKASVKPSQSTPKTQDSADKSVKASKSDKSVKSDKSAKSDKSSKTDSKAADKAGGKKDKAAAKTPPKESAKVKQKSSTKLNNIDLSSGKSCLFPMLPLELIRQIQRFPLSIHVFRKSPEEMTVVGQCKLRLGGQFEDAIIKAVYDNDPLPITTTLECDIKLNNVFSDQTGRISIFIRLSCFGATIVTQFQLRGQEHQDYIFKTSKKDNTMEAQKKKGFLYGGGPYKKENVVKPLAHRNDISPLKPIMTDETTTLRIGSSIQEDEFPTSVPYKIVPWKKYTKQCGCEHLDEDWLSESDPKLPSSDCVSRSCQRSNDLRAPSPPPCPLSDCDCYNSDVGSQRQVPNKCPIGDCECFNSRRQLQNRPTYQQDLMNQGRMKGGGCCSQGNNIQGSQGRVEQTINPRTSILSGKRQSAQENMNCPVGDCDCYKKNANKKTQNCTNGNGPYSFRQRLASSTQNDPNAHKRSLIDKYLLKDPENATHQNCNDYRKMQQEITDCFFADLHVKNEMEQNKCGQPDKSSKSTCGCNIGTNNRGENFCYSGGSTDEKVSSRSMAGPYDGTSPCGKDKRYSQSLRASLGVMKGDSVPPATSTPVTTPQTPEAQKRTSTQLAKRRSKNDVLGGGDTKSEPTVPPTTPPSITPPTDLKKPSEPGPLKKTPTERKSEEPLKKRQSTHKEKEKSIQQSDKSGGDSVISERELYLAKKKRRKYYRSIYRYTLGMYPGVNIGHKHCSRLPRLVPKTMGWLWNIGNTGDGLPMRRGWKPGAINRKIATMMKTGKKASSKHPEAEEVAPPKAKAKKKKPNQTRSGTTASSQNHGDGNTGPQSPTLHIHKKDGAYFIAMNPLKTDSEDDDDDRAPLMFKILPHEDEESTSSESSLEIEFTAPGAFRKKTVKPKMIEIDTQYSGLSVVELFKAPGKGKKGEKGEKEKGGGKKPETPDSSKASEPKDNKWDADQQTQVAKTKK